MQTSLSPDASTDSNKVDPAVIAQSLAYAGSLVFFSLNAFMTIAEHTSDPVAKAAALLAIKAIEGATSALEDVTGGVDVFPDLTAELGADASEIWSNQLGQFILQRHEQSLKADEFEGLLNDDQNDIAA